MTEDSNFTEMVEAAEAATGGEWTTGRSPHNHVVVRDQNGWCLCQMDNLTPQGPRYNNERDARHIALSNPQAVLKLHAALVEARRERDEAREALGVMVYETTSLSPMEDDGSHWCRIGKSALEKARAALADGAGS